MRCCRRTLKQWLLNWQHGGPIKWLFLSLFIPKLRRSWWKSLHQSWSSSMVGTTACNCMSIGVLEPSAQRWLKGVWEGEAPHLSRLSCRCCTTNAGDFHPKSQNAVIFWRKGPFLATQLSDDMALHTFILLASACRHAPYLWGRVLDLGCADIITMGIPWTWDVPMLLPFTMFCWFRISLPNVGNK